MNEAASSLYRRVYHTLRGRILSGEYEPGAQIETERELTRQLGASVITIRQAEQLLVEEGLLDKQQGRGTFVPAGVRRQLRVLCVCGLHLAQGLRQRMGGYSADLIVLSQQETTRRSMVFETVWLSTHEPERIRPYYEESVIRGYWGFLFLACSYEHPLVQRVRELKRRHVLVSAGASIGNGVWIDYPEAIRLGIEALGPGDVVPPIIMGIASLRARVEAVLQEKGRHCPQVYLPEFTTDHSYEIQGFQRTEELLRQGMDMSRVLFLDDVVAQGATRALLKHGYAARELQVVVICGRQQIIPLGLPVTYVVHDTLEEVRQAFEMLDRQQGRNEAELPSWRSPFQILSEA